jgi:dienelactone hydrolase
LVVHEWWGLNDYARKRARMLAGLGYTALAVDMYGEGKTAAHPKEAGQFSQELMDNIDVEKARFLAALEVLKRNETVDPSRIAAIGYCFGGGVVLQMAREGIDLKGVVSFHGILATQKPAKPGVVKAKILVAQGADDKFVTPEQVKAFRKEMDDAGVTYKLIEYSGATHSFTNPGADDLAKKFNIPIGYNAEADKKSWNDMQRFLNDIFKQ